jgi:hypothetical protein
MAKNKITEYSTSAASNTDVGNIQIEGSDNVANFDNAFRELMKHIADLNTGDSFIHDTYKIADSDEETKLAKFDAGSITAGQTRTFTFPDKDGTFAMSADVLANTAVALIDSSDDGSKNTALNLPSGTTAQEPSSPDGVQIRYDTTLSRLRYYDGSAYHNVQQGNAGAYAELSDVKTSSTNGGDFNSGSWVTRTLNNKVDRSGSVTLSSNAFTPAKDGYAIWSAPAFEVNGHQTRLYNVTDSTVVALGTSMFSDSSYDGYNSSTGSGPVLAGKEYRIEHRCESTRAGSGLGQATSWGDNIYTRVELW